MKIKIIVVGKTKENFLQIGEEEFRKRLKRYIEIEWIVVKPEKIPDKCDETRFKASEEERIKQRIGQNEWVVVLDSRGKQMSSEKFAEFFQLKMMQGIKNMTFIIGGPLGLSDAFVQQANQSLGLSKMTFTHEMVRLILLEQIYRAFTIIKGEKYHK